MAAGIVAAKSLEARRAALEQECAALEAQLAERDAEFARLANEVAELTELQAARAAGAATAPTSTGVNIDTGLPAVKAAAPVDPVAAARAKVDAELGGLALFSREPGGPEKGSRTFWREALDRLGQHLLPSGTPDDRLRMALRDPHGADFLAALQQCLR